MSGIRQEQPGNGGAEIIAVHPELYGAIASACDRLADKRMEELIDWLGDDPFGEKNWALKMIFRLEDVLREEVADEKADVLPGTDRRKDKDAGGGHAPENMEGGRKGG